MSQGGQGGGSSSLGPEVWKGLLNWTLQHQDGTAPTDPASMVGAMDNEKKQFLEKVMEGTFVDLATRMKDHIQELDGLVAKDDEQSLDRIEGLWEEIHDQVENLDIALLFCQVGGLPTLVKYLLLMKDRSSSDNNTVQKVVLALGTLAALNQNNPKVQEEVFAYGRQTELDIVGLLSGFVTEKQADSKLMAKALHALSCSIRGQALIEDNFVTQHARSVFTAALAPQEPEKDGIARVQNKALFFLQALIGADSASQERIDTLLPLIPLVVPALVVEDSNTRHSAARVISEVCNRIGGPQALMAKENVGAALQAAMKTWKANKATLTEAAGQEEIKEEVRFWKVLEEGGTFVRDGETEEDVINRRDSLTEAAVTAGGGEGQGQQAEEEEEEEEHQQTPVLLLEPAKLTGASQAP